MTTIIKSAKRKPLKVPVKKAPSKKVKPTHGGLRQGAGTHELVPNKVRKTVDIPSDIAGKIIDDAKSDISSYMRKATYNQMVRDKLISREYADKLISWKKK